jgi:hypothetical protein
MVTASSTQTSIDSRITVMEPMIMEGTSGKPRMAASGHWCRRKRATA